jgi:hypothetical protein
MMEHDTILKSLSHMCFDDTWLNWTKHILHFGHSSILINGLPAKSFHCKGGVCEGDLLSPLLFVASAELLLKVKSKAYQEWHLQLQTMYA